MPNPFSEPCAAADFCIHAANVCYLLSYLTRDMLWLRIMTCAGLMLGIVYFTCGSQPMGDCALWQASFLGINLIQIARLQRYRERIRLSEEEAALSAEAFADLSREELADLLTRSVRVGTRQAIEESSVVLSEGELSEDEVVLRDMAFGGLSRHDLLNLVTRRFHGTMYHLTPSRVRSWTKRRKRRREERRVERVSGPADGGGDSDDSL